MGVVDQLTQGEVDRALVRAVATTAALVGPPLPVGQMMITGGYFTDMVRGDTDGFNPVEAFVRRDYRE